jgi:hypothetical protein
MNGIMDPFMMAEQMLGDLQVLSPGQLAQLRAINSKYQQRVFTLTRSGSAKRELTEGEISELEAMVRGDILAMLTPEQTAIARKRRALSS